MDILLGIIIILYNLQFYCNIPINESINYFAFSPFGWVESEVLAAMIMKDTIFWLVTQWHFRGMYRFYLQSQRVSQT
jgi:hypothetical protein